MRPRFNWAMPFFSVATLASDVYTLSAVAEPAVHPLVLFSFLGFSTS